MVRILVVSVFQKLVSEGRYSTFCEQQVGVAFSKNVSGKLKLKLINGGST